jgi:hypothetical protein
VPITPAVVEPLAERTRHLYAAAKEHVLGIVARQLAAGLDAPAGPSRSSPPSRPCAVPNRPSPKSLAKPSPSTFTTRSPSPTTKGTAPAVAKLGAMSPTTPAGWLTAAYRRRRPAPPPRGQQAS